MGSETSGYFLFHVKSHNPMRQSQLYWAWEQRQRFGNPPQTRRRLHMSIAASVSLKTSKTLQMFSVDTRGQYRDRSCGGRNRRRENMVIIRHRKGKLGFIVLESYWYDSSESAVLHRCIVGTAAAVSTRQTSEYQNGVVDRSEILEADDLKQISLSSRAAGCPNGTLTEIHRVHLLHGLRCLISIHTIPRE